MKTYKINRTNPHLSDSTKTYTFSDEEWLDILACGLPLDKYLSKEHFDKLAETDYIEIPHNLLSIVNKNVYEYLRLDVLETTNEMDEEFNAFLEEHKFTFDRGGWWQIKGIEGGFSWEIYDSESNFRGANTILFENFK